MGFKELEKTVFDKAEKKSDSIIREAEAKAKEIQLEANKENQLRQKKADEETRQLIEQIKKREIASGRLDAKKALLLTKKDLIEGVFSDVRTNLAKKMSKSDKKQILQKLNQKAASEIDVGSIYCNRADATLLKNATVQDMLGGLIAESKDKTTIVDYSFDTMIDDIKDKHIAEVTGILFK